MWSNHFYATLNQFAVYFDVPMAIQNTARFESVNDYRVPISHLMFGTSICLIKVTLSFYYLYSQLVSQVIWFCLKRFINKIVFTKG